MDSKWLLNILLKGHWIIWKQSYLRYVILSWTWIVITTVSFVIGPNVSKLWITYRENEKWQYGKSLLLLVNSTCSVLAIAILSSISAVSGSNAGGSVWISSLVSVMFGRPSILFPDKLSLSLASPNPRSALVSNKLDVTRSSLVMFLWIFFEFSLSPNIMREVKRIASTTVNFIHETNLNLILQQQKKQLFFFVRIFHSLPRLPP